MFASTEHGISCGFSSDIVLCPSVQEILRHLASCDSYLIDFSLFLKKRIRENVNLVCEEASVSSGSGPVRSGIEPL